MKRVALILLAIATLLGCCLYPKAPMPSNLVSQTVALVGHPADMDVPDQIYCSGVFISPIEILTAEHCLSALSHKQGDLISFKLFHHEHTYSAVVWSTDVEQS